MSYGMDPVMLEYMRQQALKQQQAKAAGPSGKYGTAGNPSNYTTGPDANGYGGPGQIAGGGKVALGSLNQPYFQQDRDRIGGLLQGQSPFAGKEWGGLVSQLQDQAAGRGPSLAQQSYAQASANNAAQLGGMVRGTGSAATARSALIQQGKIGQGMSAGLATARTQEQQGAQSALASALSSRDQINQNSYLTLMAQQLGLSDGQLRALMADQQFALEDQKNKQQNNANKANAVAGLLGGFARMGG